MSDSTGGRAHNPKEQNVEVIKVMLQEQCQRMRFFFFDSVWRGAVGCTQRACAAPQSTPHARFDSECKRWNLEHVVLDLFSHLTVGNSRWSLSAHV